MGALGGQLEGDASHDDAVVLDQRAAKAHGDAAVQKPLPDARHHQLGDDHCDRDLRMLLVQRLYVIGEWSERRAVRRGDDLQGWSPHARQ
jgi:hypothetical protein